MLPDEAVHVYTVHPGREVNLMVFCFCGYHTLDVTRTSNSFGPT